MRMAHSLTRYYGSHVQHFCRRWTITLQHGYSWLVASSPWQILSSTMAYIDTWWGSQIYIYQVYTCEELASHTQGTYFNAASSLITWIHTFLCAGRNDFSAKIRLCQYLQMVWPGKFMVTLIPVSCNQVMIMLFIKNFTSFPWYLQWAI